MQRLAILSRMLQEQIRQVARLRFRKHDVPDAVLVRFQIRMVDYNFSLIIRADFEIAFGWCRHRLTQIASSTSSARAATATVMLI